jgi:hypothetical protein
MYMRFIATMPDGTPVVIHSHWTWSGFKYIAKTTARKLNSGNNIQVEKASASGKNGQMQAALALQKKIGAKSMKRAPLKSQTVYSSAS